MRILLYNPDNGVTRNFMPHLWMFLLQSLTPKGHQVVLIDGNAQPMDEAGIAHFVREQNIGLVGIGAMTRMIAKAYRMADAIRAVGVPVVMGGPHVTEEADEALGRNGGPRHADAVALGEADETWPKIVEDAARGILDDLWPSLIGFTKSHRVGMARTTVSTEGFVGFFRDVRSAHHHRHPNGSDGIGHAVGLGDHAGHRTDPHKSDVLFAHKMGDAGFIHGLRVAVN